MVRGDKGLRALPLITSNAGALAYYRGLLEAVEKAERQSTAAGLISGCAGGYRYGEDGAAEVGTGAGDRHESVMTMIKLYLT